MKEPEARDLSHPSGLHAVEARSTMIEPKNLSLEHMGVGEEHLAQYDEAERTFRADPFILIRKRKPRSITRAARMLSCNHLSFFSLPKGYQ